MTSSPTVFSPGTLVQARRRLWRVDSQQDSILFLTAIDETNLQTRIYLPLEPVQTGQLPMPDPAIVGSVQSQDLMLRAFRLSMLHSTAPLLAMQRSRAIPVAFQLVPVVMALGQQPVRMLIADDIGLGKTIEAGLVISELMARGLARRILVVCPASLREQWQQALDYFFHIEAKILSRTERRYLERGLPVGSNLLEFYPVFIVSVDYAKAAEIKAQILEVPWDVVLIDEAHQVAKPHQTSADQRVRMERWELGKALAFSPKIKHLLLLTATPHNGYTDSFASLLRLLDVDAVDGTDHEPIIDRETVSSHVVQRRREDVISWMHGVESKRSTFPERDQKEEYITISSEERQVIEAVNGYGSLVLEHARTARAQIQMLASWTVLHLHKRALSSPEALRRSLKNRREALKQRLEAHSEEDAGLPFEAARANVLDEDFGEQFDEEEIVERSEKVVPGDQKTLKAEFKALDELEDLAERVKPSKDSKLQHLLRNMLRPRLAQKHKVIIFTRYRDTMAYVAGQIGKSPLYSHVKVEVLHGGLNDKRRKEALQSFDQAKDAVLVATDALSEGVNLQYYASQMIHYELAWNPNRLEQRNGRIDRFGQPEAMVWIRTLVMNETLDATILKVMMEKALTIRHDYGFAPPFFGDEANIVDFIKEYGLGLRVGAQQLYLDLFNEKQVLPDEIPELYKDEVIERIRNESFYGQTELSLQEIEEQMRQVEASVGSRQEIERFVRSGLSRLNCGIQENEDGTLSIALHHPCLQLPGKGDLIPRATFDPERGLDDTQIDILDLGHAVVRAMLDLFKLEAFQPQDEGGKASPRYGRTAVMVTQDTQEMTALYTLLIRYATQTKPPQILEDLHTIAIPVYGEGSLPLDLIHKLKEARPAQGIISAEESGEVISEALNRSDLQELLAEQIEVRQERLVQDRQAVRETLGKHSGWMEGAEDVELASWDLLAVKVLWPA